MSEGAKLRRIREEAGLSQEQLAERLGVTRITVIRWEQAEKLPKRRFEQIANLLGHDPEQLRTQTSSVDEYVRTLEDAREWWDKISIMDLDISGRLIMGILATSEFLDRSTGIVAFTEDDLVKRGNLPVEVVERYLPLVLESPWIERLGNAKYAVKLKMPPVP